MSTTVVEEKHNCPTIHYGIDQVVVWQAQQLLFNPSLIVSPTHNEFITAMTGKPYLVPFCGRMQRRHPRVIIDYRSMLLSKIDELISIFSAKNKSVAMLNIDVCGPLQRYAPSGAVAALVRDDPGTPASTSSEAAEVCDIVPFSIPTKYKFVYTKT